MHLTRFFVRMQDTDGVMRQLLAFGEIRNTLPLGRDSSQASNSREAHQRL